MPVISFFVRALDSIPVYRKQDEGADTSRNRETFERAAELLRRGGTIAICPEGASHSEPYLLPLKTGAARIALGAVNAAAVARPSGRASAFACTDALPDGRATAALARDPSALDLKIVPAGLYYTAKTTFRSGALLYFGEPIAVKAVAPGDDGEPPRESV